MNVCVYHQKQSRKRWKWTGRKWIKINLLGISRTFKVLRESQGRKKVNPIKPHYNIKKHLKHDDLISRKPFTKAVIYWNQNSIFIFFFYGSLFSIFILFLLTTVATFFKTLLFSLFNIYIFIYIFASQGCVFSFLFILFTRLFLASFFWDFLT